MTRLTTMIALGGITLGALLWWRGSGPKPATAGATNNVETARPKSQARPASAPKPATELVAGTQRRLRGGLTPAEARATLEELAARLNALPAAEAATVAREFLRSGQDAPSGQGFKPRSDGSLQAAPTLRVFLMDALARLDPVAAAELARETLREKTSPDEWAIALRNVARVDRSAEGRAFLEGKVGELLRREAWQINPSEGYLEAFDVAVHVGGANLVPPLAELLKKQDNQAVAHAAFLALDRMTIQDASTTLGALLAQPELMAGREPTRANYFARADVRDAGQREVLERYLLNPALGAAELERFAGLYPNANFMISQNLLTRSDTPDKAALVARDSAALRVLDGWLADARFARARPELAKARERLAMFVQQATGK
ncbi:MAG TPA: hypothetical protein VGK40_05690 [Verrucomicrobiae bacterium]